MLSSIVKFQLSSKRKSLALRVTCYKHEFGVVGKGKNSRIRFSMFPTWEIGFGCHVTLVLKFIDLLQKVILTLYVIVTNKVFLVNFHRFYVKLLK